MGNNVKRAISILLAGILSLSLFGLVACSQAQSTASDSGSEAGTNESEHRVLGEEDEAVLKLNITNETEKTITDLAIKGTEDNEFKEAFIDTSYAIEAGETVTLYVGFIAAPLETSENTGVGSRVFTGTWETSETNVPGVTEGADPQSVVLNTLYTVLVTFEDSTTAELHDLDLAMMAGIVITQSEDGIFYIEFVAGNGITGSTLETERALAVAQAEAEAAAQALAEAEAEAQAQAEAEAAAAAEASNYGYSNSTGSTGGGQRVDDCLDVVLN